MPQNRKKLDFTPGVSLYRSVRAGLILKGTSLHAWSVSKGLNESNVRSALQGGWTGPKARKLIRDVARDAGIALTEAA